MSERQRAAVAAAIVSVVAASSSSSESEQGARCYRFTQHLIHAVVRLAQMSCVFMSTQPVFIDLAHRPTSGCSEVSDHARTQLFNL